MKLILGGVAEEAKSWNSRFQHPSDPARRLPSRSSRFHRGRWSRGGLVVRVLVNGCRRLRT
jgi:hypothetical protein